MVNYFTIKTQKFVCCTFMAPALILFPSEEVWSLVSQCVPRCPRAVQPDWLSSGVSLSSLQTHQWHCSVVKTGAMCMHQCLLLLFSCSHLLQQFFSPYITLSSWEEWACAFSGNPSSPNLPNYWIINLSCHSSCQVSHCLAAQFCFVWFAGAIKRSSNVFCCKYCPTIHIRQT